VTFLAIALTSLPSCSLAELEDGPRNAGSCSAAIEACTHDADCGVATECATPVCQAGCCTTQNTSEGLVLSDQKAGDCRILVCDGAGSPIAKNDDTDKPVDADTCRTGACVNGNPVQTFEPTKIASLAIGENHTCVRKGNGALWCWGSSEFGQLGIDGIVSSPIALFVSALGQDVADVAAGSTHTCARTTTGTIACWGSNEGGEVGDGTNMDAPSPVELKSLGNSNTQIALGTDHSCSRRADSSLFCWGRNGYGQVGDGTTDNANAPVLIKVLGQTVTQVAPGTTHTCALKSNGTVWCWGENTYEELGNGTSSTSYKPVEVVGLEGVVDVVSGYDHTCARKKNGSLSCWGANDHGQLGTGSIDFGGAGASNVITLGTDVAEVGAGEMHTCARKTDGSVWCWGGNMNGQVGDGTTMDRTTPVEITTLGKSVVKIAIGFDRSCAETNDGKLWCWGINENGLLGDGTTTEAHSPVAAKISLCQ
jgi:alpha-tubulin suppressor-like RCC1 family protein